MTEEGFLHISKVLRDHAGTYDFIVSNSSGSVEGCTKLIVYLKDRKLSRMCTQAKISSNPVKQEEFGEHVAKYHKNSDSGFSDEFDVSSYIIIYHRQRKGGRGNGPPCIFSGFYKYYPPPPTFLQN